MIINGDAGGPDDRRDELASSLAAVRRRIADACAGAGRDVDAVTLVVVTKTFPADDVRHLAGLGVTDVGENRDQDAAPKAPACADLALRWHFVGQLQTNKTRSVATYADVVHAVDRLRLVTALDSAAGRAGRTLRALVQVDLADDADGSDGRGGARPAGVAALADALAGAEHLELGGVMAVAPLGDEPRAAFDRLVAVAEQVRRDHPGATDLSAGMSADLEEAVAAGATHLRVGSAVLGRRPRSG